MNIFSGISYAFSFTGGSKVARYSILKSLYIFILNPANTECS